MIPCTEFIPCYSELFTWLEEQGGPEEVRRFWKYLFEPDGKGIPLVTFVEREGIRGCFTYWSGTLNEEAADFTMYLNEKAGWFLLEMHRCPSKGRLLALREEIGLEPYRDYCLHCDSYRAAVEKAGLRYVYNFAGIDRAACSILIWDPAVFDGRVIVDPDTEIMERKASENEYFHRDFHSSMNMGVEYLGTHYGREGVESFFRRYADRVYGRQIAEIREKGIPAMREMIADTYRREKAEEAVSFEETDGSLLVDISRCPAVEHLRKTGREVSGWYVYTTSAVMDRIAEAVGLRFRMETYDEATGAARYRFER